VVTEPDAAALTLTSKIPAEQDIEHVLIISIDGMRPDGLEQADTPTLDRLKARGAYSSNAQTINPSFTLPAHVSMLNGVVPQKHGIVEALPCIGCRLTIGPTVFSAAHDAGFSTGMVFGKEKLSYLVLENSVDALFGIDAHDPEVTSEAIKIIEGGLPNLLFIHLPDTDGVGHEYGWMSENYLYAINYADGMVDEIVTTLDNEGYLVSTLLIILADHGGHDFQHGLDCPEDMTIPWLALGPGVPQGKTLTSPINIYDTAATALYALGVAIPEHWDGRPVLEIFE
jgi:arylsulfatase A-like enzyme